MDYPFLKAVKQAFDQTSEKSGGQVFWRLDGYLRGTPKLQLIHNNSSIGDPRQSWELLKVNLENQYRWGGVRQFEMSFRQSVTDSQPKIFPLDLTNEQAVNAMAAKGASIAGFDLAGMEGAGGIAGLFKLMAEKSEAETNKRIAELEHKHELEKLRDEIKGTKTSGDRFFETLERLLDKPGVPEKILDKMFPEQPMQVAGGPQSDNAAAGDGGTDFTGLIRERMAQMNWEVANVDVDYNKSIEATLILKQVPGVDDPGQLLKGVAEFVKANPARAMQIFSELQNSATA